MHLTHMLSWKGNSQERFRFAKTVVAARKRGVARDAEGMARFNYVS